MAGIDRSNVDGDADHALLLPMDPDASAATIRSRLMQLTGVPLGVVISDSHGRRFRVGNTGVALGAAGICSVRHLEGEPDLFGRPLTGASVVPLADLISSAATLASGEADEGRPVVIIRGIDVTSNPGPASDLVPPESEDLFCQPDRAYGG
jgi:coenzyme F420-0:L-glutamate ligase/coenzyme F420-1:gamma-L-glutamate ligase